MELADSYSWMRTIISIFELLISPLKDNFEDYKLYNIRENQNAINTRSRPRAKTKDSVFSCVIQETEYQVKLSLPDKTQRRFLITY